MSAIFHLYLDDSGSRTPDREVSELRLDGMDHFALGGFVVSSEEVEAIDQAVLAFKERFGITVPLHSNSIRTKKNDWSWLNADGGKSREFHLALGELIKSIPVYAIACVVHRPGYNARYKEVYGESRWKMCKTAYTIVTERAAKFARKNGRRLMVYVEQTGPREDGLIRKYHKDILESGMYFSPTKSEKYSPLTGDTLSKILFKNPNFVTKKNSLAQLADLILYPVCKGRYEPAYPPFRLLHESGRLIETALEPGEHDIMGTKHFCFDGL